MKILFSLLLSFACLQALPAQEESEAPAFNAMREWTSADGNSTFKGKVTKYDGKTVRITPVGKNNVEVALDKISEKDRAWLEENKTVINSEGKPETSSEPATEIGRQLQKVKPLFNKKIDVGAKYYLVLFSASWCGPCRREMPEIVKIYDKKITQDPNVELIHVSCDDEKASAKEWAKNEKMKFPAVNKDALKKLPLIAANQPRGIPHMYLYDGKGNMMDHSSPSQILKTYEDKIKAREASADK